MNFKTLFFVLVTLNWAYETLLQVIGYRSMYNPVPECVSDIYDAAKYQEWRAYHRDHGRFQMLANTASFIINVVLVATDAYAHVAVLAADNAYAQLLAVLALSIVVDFVTGAVTSYISNMVIEQKYGFNRMTIKRFVIDQVKELLVLAAIECGLVSLFALLHINLGAWTLLLFSIVLVVLLGVIMFLYPVLSKAFNKFEPLPDGELKDRLVALLTRYGYKVKAIEVIQASERTTKSNAYFTGFGHQKTIVLYDNLLTSMTTDEIVAVFAHEMGHGLHRDTLRQNAISVLMFVTIAAALFLAVSYPAIYQDFGFAGVNYGFAFLLLAMVLMPVISTLFSIVINHCSRTAEYRADHQAVEEGLGSELISALKKLARDNFSNLAPSPLLVKLKYSHPTIAQRIEAINAASNPSKHA